MNVRALADALAHMPQDAEVYIPSEGGMFSAGFEEAVGVEYDSEEDIVYIRGE